MFTVSTLPSLAVVTAALFIGMGCLGMGNGAIFQLVPQRFQQEIGMVTGIVGAAGGIGGFFLPNILGTLKQVTGTYSSGFLTFSAIAFIALGLLLFVQAGWKKQWKAAGKSIRI
ncbi:Nitrate transporter [Bacillus sonorensis]|uniref:Nitrate transporter n=2 Tax=Bacillus sonorensis TaxID=119858 RepID=A0ABM6LP03_9BACI|nr:Nitrate transporter [Bacillus sonorensis]TWK73856.1 Nitrate transporter [Bacillus paralicheniformis]